MMMMMYTMVQMKKAIPVLLLLSMMSVWATVPTVLSLPPVVHVDTEVTTNFAFSAWEPRQRQFAYELAFEATPSNNFEVAFGRDDNGVLSRAEADFIVGWDCGEWFASVALRTNEEGAVASTNLVACDVQPMGTRRLRVVFTTGRAGAVRAASAQLCAPGVTNELFAAPFAWPYDPHWNRVRLTARGFDEPSASFCSQTTPDGSTITLR